MTRLPLFSRTSPPPAILIYRHPDDVSSSDILQRNTNHIVAHIRPGGRSKSALDELTREVTAAWAEVVNPHARPSVAAPTSRSESVDTELRTVFVLGTISAAREAGFVLPEVGLAILDFAFLVRYAVGLGGWG